jgi:hypothetical protein
VNLDQEKMGADLTLMADLCVLKTVVQPITHLALKSGEEHHAETTCPNEHKGYILQQTGKWTLKKMDKLDFSEIIHNYK